MAVTVASLEAKLSLNKSGFDQGMSGAKGALSSFAGNLAAMGAQKAFHLVGDGARIAGEAIADSVQKSSQLEAQLSSIGAVSGASAAEIQMLKDQIVNLGIDPNLKVSTFEAADAIEMLSRNGLTVTEILDGAAKATVLLANSTGGDFATSADIATDAMSLFGISAEDTLKSVDGITSVVTNSKFDINDYRLALAQAGGVASSVGVEFDDFNTAIAGIAPLFASGSDAGTSFKVMLQRLVPVSGPAADALSDLGILAEDGTNAFFTATGEMKSMAEIAGVLDAALSGLSDEEKAKALNKAFGTDAMRAAIGLAELGADGYNELQAAMSNTSATDAAATRMDNLAGSLEIFNGTIEAIKIKIGDALNPAIRTFVDIITNFVSNTGGFDEWLSNAAQILEEFAEKITAAGSPLLEFGRVVKEDVLGPVSDLLSSLGGFDSVDDTLKSMANSVAYITPLLEAFGTTVDTLGWVIDGNKDLFGWFDTKLGSIGIKADTLKLAFEKFGQVVAIMTFPLYGVKLALDNITESLNNLTPAVTWAKDKWKIFKDTLADVKLPKDLTPGSPTPFEMGLRGIGKAITEMPELSFGGNVSTMPVTPQGTTNNYNFGGFSASVNTQQDGGSEAIRLIMQMLQAELAR